MIVNYLNSLELKMFAVIFIKIFIDSYFFWSKTRLVNFNVLTCHVITITNNKSHVPFSYKMNDVSLEYWASNKASRPWI